MQAGLLPSASWLGTQGLLAHDVMPHLPGGHGCGRCQGSSGAPSYRALRLQTALASGPAEPRIEAASRDIERPTNHCQRPRPSVFRNEAELHMDSLAR